MRCRRPRLLVICVLGDPAVAAALEQSARNQILEGHRMVVWKGIGEGSVHSCHVLYVGGSVERQVQAPARHGQGTPRSLPLANRRSLPKPAARSSCSGKTIACGLP